MPTENTGGSAQPFEILKEVVISLYESRGVPLRPPTIKGALLGRLNGFNEKQLGYSKFSDFLAEAARHKHIALGRDEQDFLAAPFGVELHRPCQPVTESLLQTRMLRPLRPDLWEAFVFVGDYLRLFDTENGQAYCLASQPSDKEPFEKASVRATFTTNPNRFIPIPPVLEQEQVQWAREAIASVADLDQQVLARLDASLRELSPIKHFMDEVQQFSAVAHQWHSIRLQRVTHRVRQWLAEHDLSLDIDVAPRRKSHSQQPFAKQTSPSCASVLHIIELRLLAKEAIDQLTASEILSLKLPLGAMLGITSRLR